MTEFKERGLVITAEYDPFYDYKDRFLIRGEGSYSGLGFLGILFKALSSPTNGLP